MPIGGIWLDGRRDFARCSSALSSGRPGVINRDVPSGCVGHHPVARLADRRGAGVGRALGVALGRVCFRNSPSDAIVLSPVVAAAAVGRQITEHGALRGSAAAIRGGAVDQVACARGRSQALVDQRAQRDHVRRRAARRAARADRDRSRAAAR